MEDEGGGEINVLEQNATHAEGNHLNKHGTTRAQSCAAELNHRHITHESLSKFSIDISAQHNRRAKSLPLEYDNHISTSSLNDDPQGVAIKTTSQHDAEQSLFIPDTDIPYEYWNKHNILDGIEWAGEGVQDEPDPRDLLYETLGLRMGVRGEERAEYPEVPQDDDTTGNYNPALQRRKRRRTQAKKRVNVTVDVTADVTTTQSSATDLVASSPAPSTAVNQPDGPRVVHIGYDGRDLTVQLEDSRFVLNLFDTSVEPEPSVENFDTRDPKTALINLRKVLKGHAVAKGCKRCYDTGERCSIRDNEYDWPCKQCNDETCDCIALTDYPHKQSCKGCTIDYKSGENWVVCSHLYERKAGACQRCLQLGRDCAFSQDPRFIRPKLHDVKPDGSADYIPRPRIRVKALRRTCKACQEAGRHCSLGGHDDFRLNACTSCEMEGIECEWFEPGLYIMEKSNTWKNDINVPNWHLARLEADDQERQRKGRKRGHKDGMPSIPRNSRITKKELKAIALAKKAKDDRETPAPKTPELVVGFTPLVVEEPKVLCFPTTRQILTKFCHPIVFNHDSIDENDQCSFCSNLAFPIKGMPPRAVEVDLLPEGKGWWEVEGGYSAEGYKSTKMCIFCTASRLQIIKCQKHEIRAIASTCQLDLVQAMDRLEMGVPTGPFCSLCASLAQYECCFRHKDRFGFDAVGCGLKLCEMCTIDLSSYQGDLAAMLALVKEHESHARPFGYRADWSLLKHNGLLLRFCGRSR